MPTSPVGQVILALVLIACAVALILLFGDARSSNESARADEDDFWNGV